MVHSGVFVCALYKYIAWLIDWLKSLLVGAVAGSSVGVYVLYKLLDTLRRLPRISRYSVRPRYILVTGCDSGFGLELLQRLGSVLVATLSAWKHMK